jgi:hypothetical protein
VIRPKYKYHNMSHPEFWFFYQNSGFLWVKKEVFCNFVPAGNLGLSIWIHRSVKSKTIKFPMTQLFKKLNFKNQERVVVINAPASFEAELLEMSRHTQIERHPDAVENIDFALVFVLNQAQIDSSIAQIFPKLQGDAILWYAYPKGSSKKYTCDFNRDTGWQTLGDRQLEPVRQVAIDEDWSALRFRKTEFIKTLTRRESYALSKSGKERIKKNAGQ